MEAPHYGAITSQPKSVLVGGNSKVPKGACNKGTFKLARGSGLSFAVRSNAQIPLCGTDGHVECASSSPSDGTGRNCWGCVEVGAARWSCVVHSCQVGE